MAFLGINHIISINYLRIVQSYWECGQFIGNEGIRNTMTRRRFKDILRNLHLWDNTKSYKNDKGFKILPVITISITVFQMLFAMMNCKALTSTK